jgi:putative aldouronate transport system substrate-binding protein
MSGSIPKTHRREFVAGAVGFGLGAGIMGQADGRQASPAAEAPPPAVQALDSVNGEFPLSPQTATLRVLIPSDPNVENFATNEFTAWYEEKTNVRVEWEIAPGSEADVNVALNTRLASGEYPDVIMGFSLGPTLQQLYGTQGLFRPLNDLIEAHGTETNRLFEQQPEVRPTITARDGNIYSLPIFAGCRHCSYSNKLWIYQPWLEQLGLALPTTTDEFEQVLLAFKEQDPNGNGQADEWPLMTATERANPVETFIMNAFTYDPGGDMRLVVQDGRVTPVYTSTEWQQGLSYLARLFAQGLIAPESFTQNGDQLRQVMNNPDVVTVGCVPALAPVTFLSVTEGEAGRWTEYVSLPPLQGPNGVRYASYNPYQALRPGQFSITDKCADPALAFRWADGLYDLETSLRSTDGVLGKHWRWANEGEVGNNGEPAIWTRLVSFGGLVNYFWGQNNPYYRQEAVHSGQVMNPEIADRSLETILFRATDENYAPYAQPAEMTLPPLFFDEADALVVAEVGATIADYVQETTARVITGQTNIEAEWETYLATLESMGLPQLLDVHQRAYDAWVSAG